jgi:putative N-acetylmannosamine-6-phosphate epimerase
MSAILEKIRHELIVAIDNGAEEPFSGLTNIIAMTNAVVVGGAAAIRIGGPQEIQAVRQVINVPIIGFAKQYASDGSRFWVTPTFELARSLADAGADIIALEATDHSRLDGLSLETMIRRIKDELNRPVIADISTLKEGVAAGKAGADLVATTLVGYTPQSKNSLSFDFSLLSALLRDLSVPVIAEGHIITPENARRVIELGAYAVVVGSMITRPHIITRYYVTAIREEKG